ncbi:MAG: SurA N-terminal domain-containing protein [Candidatus Omnitrophica bacterium]|nr:SurA N-terminal domain-containing protein [Candidatus Omnitrophota bacterium]
MIKKIIILILFSLSSVLAEEKILAIVNNEVITRKDLENFINSVSSQFDNVSYQNIDNSLKKEFLDKLIEDRLILQEAEKEKIKVEPSLIESRIKEIRDKYPSEKEFVSSLSQLGLTPSDLEIKIKEQILIQRMLELKIRNKIVVKPLEVNNYYQENKEEFIKPVEYELTVVKLENEDLANAIKEEIKKGKVLEEIINTFSLKPTYIKVKKNTELKLEIEQAISKLRVKETSLPVKIENIFYIFRLEKINPAIQEDFESVKERIYNYLFQKKFKELLDGWIEELKKNAYIKINEEEL